MHPFEGLLRTRVVRRLVAGIGKVLLLAFQPMRGKLEGPGVVLSLISALVPTGLRVVKVIPLWMAILLTALVVGMLLMWAAVRLQWSLDEFNAKQPKIEFTRTRIVEARLAHRTHMLDTQTGKFDEQWAAPSLRPQVAMVVIVNDPPGHPKDAILTNAEAVLAFFSVERKLLVRVQARWADNPQAINAPGPIPHLDPLRKRDIPANGGEHGIDIAIWHPGDEVCYALNEEIWGTDGLRREGQELAGDTFAVKVTIKGEGIGDVSEWFKLTLDPVRGMDLGLLDPDPELAHAT